VEKIVREAFTDRVRDEAARGVADRDSQPDAIGATPNEGRNP